eukprot:scaffold86367_cov86-Phaeocystis_antarctica.AAC.1
MCFSFVSGNYGFTAILYTLRLKLVIVYTCAGVRVSRCAASPAQVRPRHGPRRGRHARACRAAAPLAARSPRQPRGRAAHPPTAVAMRGPRADATAPPAATGAAARADAAPASLWPARDGGRLHRRAVPTCRPRHRALPAAWRGHAGTRRPWCATAVRGGRCSRRWRAAAGAAAPVDSGHRRGQQRAAAAASARRDLCMRPPQAEARASSRARVPRAVATRSRGRAAKRARRRSSCPPSRAVRRGGRSEGYAGRRSRR